MHPDFQNPGCGCRMRVNLYDPFFGKIIDFCFDYFRFFFEIIFSKFPENFSVLMIYNDLNIYIKLGSKNEKKKLLFVRILTEHASASGMGQFGFFRIHPDADAVFCPILFKSCSELASSTLKR